MRSRVLILAGILGLLLLSTSALAHHGAASLYDVSKETTVKVTITFNPGLRGTRIGRLLKVVLPDGKELRA